MSYVVAVCRKRVLNSDLSTFCHLAARVEEEVTGVSRCKMGKGDGLKIVNGKAVTTPVNQGWFAAADANYSILIPYPCYYQGYPP